ncbi:unnamed protein product, partial [Closterium sp. NIES-53]
VSQVDPLPGTAPVEVAVGSGAASGVAASGGAEPVSAKSEGAESGGAEPRGEETEGAEPAGVEPGGVEFGGAELEDAEPRGTGVAGDGGVGAVDPGGTVRPRPYFVPLLQQVLGVPSFTSLTPPLLCLPPNQSQLQLQPASPLPAPSPYTEQSDGLTERREPASRRVSPIRTARCVPRSRPPPVSGTHALALRPSSVPLRVPLPAPPGSSLPEVPEPESDHARAASPTVSRLLAIAFTDPSFECAAASALVAELLDFAAACRLDYATALEDFECLPAAPAHYVEAITGPYFFQWQAAMDAEMASWKSTGTYVDEVPPPGANIVDGMWIFRVKRPTGSPPAFKARYVARGFSQRQGVDFFQTFFPTRKMTTLLVLLHVAAKRDYELHSLDFSTAFLQGSLHEEIWLRRPHGFTGTTPATLGFAPSIADPSLFLRTDTSLPPFYVFVYVFVYITRDRARRTITLTRSHIVHQVLQRFGFQFSSPQTTPLSIGHSLSAPPSDESVEPSGLYPELVGCLMYLMTCTRPDLAYPLSLLARYVAPVRRALGSCLEDGVQFSSCEAEIYAGAMAAQELRWLTYLLTDLGEQSRSPPVLYVDNKAMIALCQEHRLKHRTKHIALRYFLARELQQRGQLRLVYVASRANTADIFTKAIPLACFAFLDWSCDHLFSRTVPMGRAAAVAAAAGQVGECASHEPPARDSVVASERRLVCFHGEPYSALWLEAAVAKRWWGAWYERPNTVEVKGKMAEEADVMPHTLLTPFFPPPHASLTPLFPCPHASLSLCQVHWWRAQSLRFMLRWPSPYLCHLTNRLRHSSLSLSIATRLSSSSALQSSLLRSHPHLKETLQRNAPPCTAHGSSSRRRLRRHGRQGRQERSSRHNRSIKLSSDEQQSVSVAAARAAGLHSRGHCMGSPGAGPMCFHPLCL